ncbi:hypothetical protein M1N63_02650 [Thermodesulfovibrionales bacterium]|nr:hypothetical protein [Thermodesulfovibrionales bacterium]
MKGERVFLKLAASIVFVFFGLIIIYGGLQEMQKESLDVAGVLKRQGLTKASSWFII